MRIRFPLLWLALVAMWVVLSGRPTLADVILGALAALGAVIVLARLEPASVRLRRPFVAGQLIGTVLLDIVRSNIAVTIIVLGGGRRDRTPGFIDIPLDVRHPAALATLACIITATPGTAWAGYDSRSHVLTMHVLDLIDDAAMVRTIKERYERRLMEIFE